MNEQLDNSAILTITTLPEVACDMATFTGTEAEDLCKMLDFFNEDGPRYAYISKEMYAQVYAAICANHRLFNNAPVKSIRNDPRILGYIDGVEIVASEDEYGYAVTLSYSPIHLPESEWPQPVVVTTADVPVY